MNDDDNDDDGVLVMSKVMMALFANGRSFFDPCDGRTDGTYVLWGSDTYDVIAESRVEGRPVGNHSMKRRKHRTSSITTTYVGVSLP